MKPVEHSKCLRAAPLIGEVFRSSGGARLGESAVASLKMHVTDLEHPEEVQIISGADAGQVFYRRRSPGEVVHLDIFHEIADIDHRRVARRVREGTERYCRAAGLDPVGILDYIDVQTGTGGGRVTGALSSGMKRSLRRAHRNHVHLTVQLSQEVLPLLFYLVQEAEGAVIDEGKELRMVERLVVKRGKGKSQADLSPYSDYSDSLLQESPGGRGWSQGDDFMNQAVSGTEKAGGFREFYEAMDDIAKGSLGTKTYRPPEIDALIADLEANGLVSGSGKELTFTDDGWRFYDFLKKHRREIEQQFYKSLRTIPLSTREALRGYVRLDRERFCKAPRIAPLQREEWIQNLSAIESARAALVRSFREGTPFSVGLVDLRRWDRDPRRPVNVCLVIDSSASMAGERIRAAKYLARHLLFNTRDRVAVIAFYEQTVRLAVPFTKNPRQLEDGLSTISPVGLTPLAHALEYSLDFCRESRVRNPLLLLITDGIPTIPRWTSDPLADALEAAGSVKDSRTSFACVGLEPNKRFLQRLTERTGGQLYVLDELSREKLIVAAHRQRSLSAR